MRERCAFLNDNTMVEWNEENLECGVQKDNSSCGVFVLMASNVREDVK